MKRFLFSSIILLGIALTSFCGFWLQNSSNLNNNINVSNLKANQADNGTLLFSWGLDQYYDSNKISVDMKGNIYVLGTKYSGEMFIVKFNETGELLWKFSQTDYYNDYGKNDFFVDVEFNVYCVNAIHNSSGKFWRLVKLNSTGILLRNHIYNGTAYYIYGDSYKNIYILGDEFLIKLNENGTILWDKTLPKTIGFPVVLYIDEFNYIHTAGLNPYYSTIPEFFYCKFNSSGHVILNITQDIEVNYDSKWFFDKTNNLYMIGAQNTEGCLLIKYNISTMLSQEFFWQFEFAQGYAGSSAWSDVVVDSEGNIYCAGTNYIWSGGLFSEVYLVKFDKAGNLLYDGAWKQRKNTSLRDLTIDKNNNIYLTGQWEYGMFVLKNPSLGEITKLGIFNIFIEGEPILYISLIFSVWFSLGIILYIRFIKKYNR